MAQCQYLQSILEAKKCDIDSNFDIDDNDNDDSQYDHKHD